MGSFQEQVARDLKGEELEKSGQVDQAIRFQEPNVKERFEGSHPYDTLAIIYRKRKQKDGEIRVLEKAIWLSWMSCTKSVATDCQD